MRQGLPKNANPFLIIWDECIDDVTLVKIAPDYFSSAAGGDMVVDRRVAKPALTQEAAEELVCQIVSYIPTAKYFAARERYQHIIPGDVKHIVRITKKSAHPVTSQGCFFGK